MALMVYIHIPFCISKCVYCDFYSIKNLSLKKNFLKALEREINLRYRGEKVSSIYFGGGTPSILEPVEIFNILSKFNLIKNCEISMECNPEDMDEKKISDYIKFGVNRFSIGVQSLNDKELEILKRRHNSKKAIKTLKLLKEKKVNFSCDLIVGIRGQTKKTLKKTLQKIISFSPPHISIYPLEMKRLKYLMQNEEKKAELLEFSWNYLNEKGYIHYEISNFSKEGFRCRHNLGYWQGKEYYGFGPSAHSFLKRTRFKNVNNINIYIKKLNKNELPIQKLEKLKRKDLEWEKFILSLRTDAGWKIKEKEREKVSEFIKEGFLEEREGKIILKDKGMLLYNQVVLNLYRILF